MDEDADSRISLQDLLRYGNNALSHRMGKRICADCRFRRGEGWLDYEDFIWFLLSEEDKTSLTAQSYWFRLLDLDGDGEVSAQDMEYFYAEQLDRQLKLSDESISFRDILCQLLDAVKPCSCKSGFTLADLRRSKMCPLVVDTLCNIQKLLAGEMHELRLLRGQPGMEDYTEWDRWAFLEYRRLSLEDGDDEEDEEDISSVLGPRVLGASAARPRESPF